MHPQFDFDFRHSKGQYDDIILAKIFIKKILFLVVYQQCNNALFFYFIF